jgi:hypothetical protein
MVSTAKGGGRQRAPAARIRVLLAGTWPLVSASYAPLVALVLARVAGASALAGRPRPPPSWVMCRRAA